LSLSWGAPPVRSSPDGLGRALVYRRSKILKDVAATPPMIAPGTIDSGAVTPTRVPLAERRVSIGRMKVPIMVGLGNLRVHAWANDFVPVSPREPGK
jgi:hypothetical protein